MPFSPIFLKTRAVVLCGLSLVGLLWAIVICVVLFSQWTVLEVSERSLIVVMLATNTITAIMLLVLLAISFRPWLDAARIMFLLTAQLGVAGAFAYFYPGFKCLNQDMDQEGVCTFIIAFILIGSWIIPILLVIYGFGLALMVWRRRAIPAIADEETGAKSQKLASDVDEKTRVILVHRSSDFDHLSNVTGSSGSSQSSGKSSSTVKNFPVAAARLSKPPPAFHF